MMGIYASTTQVSSDRSKSEIEKILRRYGAIGFAYGWNPKGAIIGFQFQGRSIRMELRLPDKSKFETSPTGKRRRNSEATLKAWEQAGRQGWRALCLVIKAKLEAIESGIASFEDEFLAYTVLPSGQTAGQWIQPQIEESLVSGRMMPMLPASIEESSQRKNGK